MAGRVLSPDLYSTAPLTAPPVVAEHMSAAATHRELAAQWMAKGDALAGSNSGALVDAAQEEAHKMAVAHQNQADMHEQTAQYHQRAADLAGSMNSSLDRVEQRAQQQLAQAKVWDWPVIMSDARIQASGINTDFTSSLAARHSASMASMGPLRSAISGLTGAAGAAASGVSMMGNPVTHGSIPSTIDWRGPQPTPQPSPQPQPHPGASAPQNASPHVPAGGTNAPHTPIGAAPAAAVLPPPAQPGQPQPGQQPAPGQPSSADNKTDDDDLGDDPDLGDDSGGMEEMIPQLLMGLMSSAAMLPQMASQAGSELAQQASQGLTQGVSQLTQGLGDDLDEGEPEELSPPSGLGSGGGTGGGIGGGAGGGSGGGAAGGGSPDHLSAPSAHDYGPGQAKPSVEQFAGTTSQTPQAAGAGGMMPGMLPMGMGGGGGGSPAAAAESRTKKVVSPKRPNTDPISGEDAQPTITVKADDTDGTPTLLKTLTRISAS